MKYSQEQQEPDYAACEPHDAPADKNVDTAQPTRWAPDMWLAWRSKRHGLRPS
jgi:hypothetical protein